MCKKYIISGKAVDKVLRENRIRISRGDLEVTPYDEAAPKQEAPIVTRVKKVIADCKDDDFDTALKKVTSFVSGLTMEDMKEFKKHENELKKYFLGK